MRSDESISWHLKNVHADHGGFAMTQVLRDARAHDEAARRAAERERPVPNRENPETPAEAPS